VSRKQRNTVDYFPHFVDEGKTLYILQQRFGNNGYAIWFKLLAELCRSENQFIDCRKEEAWQYLVARMMVDEITATEMLGLLAKLGNIDAELWENKIIWCENLVENLKEVYRKRGRNLPEKPKLSQLLNNCHQESDNSPQPATEMPQSKVKYSKVNKKEILKKEGSSQLPDGVKELVSEFLKLPGWGNSQLANDVEWLSEFLTEFPNLSVSHIRGCKDFHMSRARTKHTKGAWKSRLRHWMTNELKWRANAKAGSKGRELPKTYTPEPEYPD